MCYPKKTDVSKLAALNDIFASCDFHIGFSWGYNDRGELASKDFGTEAVRMFNGLTDACKVRGAAAPSCTCDLLLVAAPGMTPVACAQRAFMWTTAGEAFWEQPDEVMAAFFACGKRKGCDGFQPRPLTPAPVPRGPSAAGQPSQGSAVPDASADPDEVAIDDCEDDSPVNPVRSTSHSMLLANSCYGVRRALVTLHAL